MRFERQKRKKSLTLQLQQANRNWRRWQKWILPLGSRPQAAQITDGNSPKSLKFCFLTMAWPLFPGSKHYSGHPFPTWNLFHLEKPWVNSSFLINCRLKLWTRESLFGFWVSLPRSSAPYKALMTIHPSTPISAPPTASTADTWPGTHAVLWVGQKFFGVFLYHLIETPKQAFWPTQYFHIFSQVHLLISSSP